MNKILLTAFRGKYNSSAVLVDNLTHDNVKKLFLTNSMNKLVDELYDLNLEGFDLVLMFGINKNLKNCLQLEANALRETNLITTTCNIKSFKAFFNERGIETKINTKPTAYLCNNAYYHALLKNPNGVFIHIPGLSKIDDLDNWVKIINEFINYSVNNLRNN